MSTQITIYGKTYNIKADSSGIDPRELAEFVDEKMHALSGTRAKPSTTDLAILTALNIAQELFEIRNQMEQLESEHKTSKQELKRRTGLVLKVLEKEIQQVKTA